MRRWPDLDFGDWVIHLAATVALAVALAAAVGSPDESLGAGIGFLIGAVALAARRHLARTSREAAGPVTGETDADRLAYLEHRVTELEERQARLHELEERLDFAERLLARTDRPAERAAIEPPYRTPPGHAR